MYEPRLDRKDRVATLALVAAIHGALAFALINLSPPIREVLPEEAIELFDVIDLVPPEEEEEVTKPAEAAPEEEAPRQEEGAASPENIRSQATPIASPRPPIQLPVPPPMPVSETPRQGNEQTQGAADTLGPGTGAGGVGTGTGSGGSGSGTGGGGSGGAATRPVVVRSITSRDYPPEVARAWPPGGAVFIAVRVLPDGRATECRINRSSGVPAIDQWTCRLVEERARFRPATDIAGRPVAAWYGYVQQDTGRR